MRRIGVLLLAAAVVAAVVVSSAQAALFFLFKPTVAEPGELVSVRLGGTPQGFRLEQRVKPFREPIRLYLAAAGETNEIRSRFDRRLSFVGRMVPDANSRGLLTFTVPPLDTNDYVVAYWCPGCARYSLGRTFGVQTVPEVSRVRHLMGFRIEMPSPSETCPVTIPRSSSAARFNHGNGLLASGLPKDGVLAARREPDGTLFSKLVWSPRTVTGASLIVRGERLDALSPTMRVLAVRWGGGSWASAVTFPSEGCWRISGRVGDITLTYVVKVVGG